MMVGALHDEAVRSFARKLGPLRKDAALGERATQVRRALERTDVPADGELVVEDAWNAYWRALGDV